MKTTPAQRCFALSAAALAFSWTASHAEDTVVIDGFAHQGNKEGEWPYPFVEAKLSDPSDSMELTGVTDALGGTREIYAEYHSGGVGAFNYAMAGSSPNFGGVGWFDLANFHSGTVDAEGGFIWSGGGSLNADFTGKTKFVVKISDSQLMDGNGDLFTAQIRVTVVSSSGSETASATVVSTFAAEQIVEIPLSLFPGTDFSSVSEIVLSMRETLLEEYRINLSVSEFSITGGSGGGSGGGVAGPTTPPKLVPSGPKQQRLSRGRAQFRGAVEDATKVNVRVGRGRFQNVKVHSSGNFRVRIPVRRLDFGRTAVTVQAFNPLGRTILRFAVIRQRA